MQLNFQSLLVLIYLREDSARYRPILLEQEEVEEEVEDTPLFKCFRSPSPSILPSGENSPPVEFYSTLSLIQVCACTYPRFELPLFAEDVKHGDWGTRARRRILNYSCLCIVLIWEFEILFLKVRGKVLSGVLSG